MQDSTNASIRSKNLVRSSSSLKQNFEKDMRELNKYNYKKKKLLRVKPESLKYLLLERIYSRVCKVFTTLYLKLSQGFQSQTCN